MNFRETRDSLESVGPEERVSLQLPLDQGLDLVHDLPVSCRGDSRPRRDAGPSEPLSETVSWL